MIALAKFENPRVAQALVDYLNLKGIRCEQHKQDEGFVIYLMDARDELNARKELDAFVANPNDPKYLDASWNSGVQLNTSLSSGMPDFIGNIKSQSGWLTQLVILLSLISFGLMQLDQNALYSALAFSEPSQLYASMEFWRLWTPALIHFSAMHLIFNLLWVWILGGRIESIQGSKKLLLLVLVTGVASNYAQYLTSPNPFGGMSGVLYGLLGYCWIYSWLIPESKLKLPNAIVGFMLFWLVLGYSGFMNMANAAHTVGLVSGCLLASLSFFGRKTSN